MSTTKEESASEEVKNLDEQVKDEKVVKINTSRRGGLPACLTKFIRLTVYSYLDQQTCILRISNLSKQERKSLVALS